MDDTPRTDRPASPDPTRSPDSTRSTGSPGAPGSTGSAGSAGSAGSTAPAGSTPPTARTTRTDGGRGVLWAVVAILIAFSAGFLWQYLEARTVRGELSAVEQELQLERLRVHLGQAALSAQSGDFERARQQMSTFFNQLQESSDAMSPEVQTIAGDYLDMRDEVITGLSRSNPEYGAILFGMHERLNAAIDRSLDGPDATEGGEAAAEGDAE